MASTNIRSTLPGWDELDRITEESNLYVDLCVVFRRNDAAGDPTGEYLYEVGGRWSKADESYVGTPKRCKTWGINEAQLGAFDDLVTWFDQRDRKDPRRAVIQSLGGPRGGGKTDLVVKFAAAFNLKFPGSKAWIFSPTLDKREEIEDMWRKWVHRPWAKNPLRWPTSVPDCRFSLINGSSTRSLSGEVPQAAKRGDGAEFIALNEAQQMRRRVFSLALPGIRKNGGLLVAAHNPPEEGFPAGEWVVDLVEKAESGKLAAKRRIAHRWIDPRKNPSVTSSTMEAIDDVLTELDPIAASADMRGLYKRLGEFVYSKFRPVERVLWVEDIASPPPIGSRYETAEGTGTVQEFRDGRLKVLLPSMVRPAPDICDVTNEVLRKAGWFGPQTVAIGTDHQTHPHQCGAAIKAYRAEDGKVIYYVTDEFVVWGQSVSEAELSHAIMNGDGAAEIEYTPAAALLVPDCSGTWQKSNRQPGANSYSEMEGLGWKCKPPTEILHPDRSTHPANPPVHRSIALVGDVMREGRFFVDPACKWVIESGPKVPYKRDGDKVKISQAGGYAHIWDCIRYVLWLLEPKKRKKVAAPKPGSVSGIAVPRTGPRML